MELVIQITENKTHDPMYISGPYPVVEQAIDITAIYEHDVPIKSLSGGYYSSRAYIEYNSGIDVCIDSITLLSIFQSIPGIHAKDRSLFRVLPS